MKRFDIGTKWDKELENDVAEMFEIDEGPYVKFSDVEKLVAALDAAKDLIQDLDSDYWNANDDENYKVFRRKLEALKEVGHE